MIIPFRLENAKTRLASVLSPDERRQLALAMLRDVLRTVSDLGQVTVLVRPGFLRLELSHTINVIESDLELNDALNSYIRDWQEKGWPSDLLMVMADLALLTRSDLQHIMETPGDVVLSPGRGGGTNMILIRSPTFRACYRGISFLKHLEMAKMASMSLGVYASYGAGCDIDEPEDLAEILIHNKGEAKELLELLGFVLSESDRGRCFRNFENEPYNTRKSD